jgi:hypothetical protein
VASVQDPLLGCGVGAHDAARVYDAAPAGKNKVLQRQQTITDYLMEGLCFTLIIKKITLRNQNSPFNDTITKMGVANALEQNIDFNHR